MTTALTHQDIYERVYQAISARKLMPGTKLSEEKLAAAFHVSRTRIREVLFRLSQELIVALQPNRGAFIASPTKADMRNVFQVRQALEPAAAATARPSSGSPASFTCAWPTPAATACSPTTCAA